RHAIYYFVPGMLNYFDSEAVVALSAPRPMLFLTGDKDAGSPVDGVRTIESTVRKVYKLYGQENQFESVIYRGVGHEYTPNMLERMLKWMVKHLKEMTNDETRRKVRLATSGENLFTVQRGLERSADFQSAVLPNCIRQG